MRWWKWAVMVLLSVVIVLGIAGSRRVIATPASVHPLLERAGIILIQDEER